MVACHGMSDPIHVARRSDSLRIVAPPGVPTKTAMSLLSTAPRLVMYRGKSTARELDGLSLDRVLGLFLLPCRSVQSTSRYGWTEFKSFEGATIVWRLRDQYVIRVGI